ncbi:MAG: hypothetical protein FJX74_15995, partial [Armatimonadetes bacterium]|nr:hypothetical protein [Armatimonadota bacterium]
MRDLLLWLSVTSSSATLAAAAPEVLIDTDFGAADQPVLGRGGQPNPRVTGVMAGNWHDDSGWADDVFASWERLEEEGRAFVRLEVGDLGEHWYQLAHMLPRIEEETFLRLSLTARSPAGCTVRIGLRDSGPPYGFHWEDQVSLGAGWSDTNLDFRLNKIDADIGFWIVVHQKAPLDLARLKLTRLSRTDYIEELRAQYPTGSPRNLLRTSTFPLGLQSGWAL